MNRLIESVETSLDEQLKKETEEVNVAISKCVNSGKILYDIQDSIISAIDSKQKDKIKRLRKEKRLQKKTDLMLLKNLKKQIDDVAWIKHRLEKVEDGE